MTDFGLIDKYWVYDSLDQKEVFLPLLWYIFYDFLLCKVKRLENICEYRLDSYLVAKTGHIESQIELTSFFAAGAFVDNTIWVRNSQTAIQYILDIARTPVNTKSVRETFYRELIQNTNLPTNHNFASIITEINKEIKHHTQQRYLITYTNKGKGKLQTPAVTPKKIQPPTWKKTRVESPTASSYHYTLGSAINITSASMSISNAISTFGQFPFQSKQRKTDLLESYSEYFERFKSRLPTPSGSQSLPLQPDFGTATLWELFEEKEEEELEDQEFTYQNLITKNPEVETPNLQTQQNLNLENSEIETLNHQRQNNLNPKLINQQNLPLVIVINQLLINPIAEPIQQPLQSSFKRETIDRAGERKKEANLRSLSSLMGQQRPQQIATRTLIE
ncbi:hypothetical protein G9A89_018043 [Geosiphon pyriformis]|nr:hypothetical protein G9A89_018043 [Geosiphon pyriformis]